MVKKIAVQMKTITISLFSNKEEQAIMIEEAMMFSCQGLGTGQKVGVDLRASAFGRVS